MTNHSTGGPGCSSTTGLLFKLGPCQIANETSVTYNKHPRNSHSNILFLDQLVNVGYSYSDYGSTVDRSAAAGEDVYAFFQLFFVRFPEYSNAPLHMAAESHGGTYAPNAASFHKKNKELALAPVPGMININPASVILANGITDPYEQTSKWPPSRTEPVKVHTLCTTILKALNVCLWGPRSRLASASFRLATDLTLLAFLLNSTVGPS